MYSFLAQLKKMKERYKDRKFHQNIHIRLENVESSSKGQLKFNTTKNNVAILNGSEIVVFVSFAFTACVLIIVHRWKITDSNHFFQEFLLKEVAMRFFWNVLLPIGYFSKKKDMRKYVWDYICYLIMNRRFSF